MTQSGNEMNTTGEPREIEALFVQSSRGMTYDNGKLILDEMAPTMLLFSDRPERVTGHLTTEEFVQSWGSGENSFASDPPNAVLSIFHPDEVQDVVVVLKRPSMAQDKISYEVDIIDGEMPAHGGPSALFIDVIGRPLSPVSVAGVHRRDRREARRVSRRI